jgi:hypothetical protein
MQHQVLTERFVYVPVSYYVSCHVQVFSFISLGHTEISFPIKLAFPCLSLKSYDILDTPKWLSFITILLLYHT